MTEDLIARLSELAEKITPGPWVASSATTAVRIETDAPGWANDGWNITPELLGPDSEANAEFIALVRNALPTILSALAERDRMLNLEHVKAVAAKVVQDACETDPADPEHPNTIMISTDDLEMIVRQALEPSHAQS